MALKPVAKTSMRELKAAKVRGHKDAVQMVRDVRQKMFNKKGVPLTRDYVEALQNSYSNEWTRLADRFNLESALGLILHALEKATDELAYSQSVRFMHVHIQEMAATLPFIDDKLLKQITQYMPAIGMIQDGEELRAVNMYDHLPSDQQDSITQGFVLARKHEEAQRQSPQQQ